MLVVVGGHSRNIGKTSVAAGLIAATRELGWMALKITQFGHGMCSSTGEECHCAVEDPAHPSALTRETGEKPGTDTARLLQAGATEAYWVRARIGALDEAVPELRKLIADRPFVLMESNSILEYFQPDLYLSVLRFDVDDFKPSSRYYLDRADATVVVKCAKTEPSWDPWTAVAASAPSFEVDSNSYRSAALERFFRSRLAVPAG
jgi:hypothetical protein